MSNAFAVAMVSFPERNSTNDADDFDVDATALRIQILWKCSVQSGNVQKRLFMSSNIMLWVLNLLILFRFFSLDNQDESFIFNGSS